MPKWQFHLPLAILLLCWRLVESVLFWGWHGKLLLPLSLHPSLGLSSATGRKEMLGFLKIITETKSFSLAVSCLGQPLHNLFQRRPCKGQLAYKILQILSNCKLFNREKARIHSKITAFPFNFSGTLFIHISNSSAGNTPLHLVPS